MWFNRDEPIRLSVTEDRIKELDVAALLDLEVCMAVARGEDSPYKIHSMINVIASFMCNEDGSQMARMSAINRLKKLKAADLQEVVTQLNNAFMGIEKEAVPNGRGGDSTE